MTTAEQNVPGYRLGLGYRINPDHINDLRKFLNSHHGSSTWKIVTHDNDACPHLIASNRLCDIAHAFTSGRESQNK